MTKQELEDKLNDLKEELTYTRFDFWINDDIYLQKDNNKLIMYKSDPPDLSSAIDFPKEFHKDDLSKIKELVIDLYYQIKLKELLYD